MRASQWRDLRAGSTVRGAAGGRVVGVEAAAPAVPGLGRRRQPVDLCRAQVFPVARTQSVQVRAGVVGGGQGTVAPARAPLLEPVGGEPYGGAVELLKRLLLAGLHPAPQLGVARDGQVPAAARLLVPGG